MRGLLYRLLFFGLSVPMALFVALVAPFSRRAVRGGARLWARWFRWCARHILRVRLDVRGTPMQQGAIIACKHESAYETIVMLCLLDAPAVVMKAELRRIPVWGYIAERHGSIFVERGRGGTALKAMLRQARARLAEGRPILIFPEGTRVAPGAQPPLKGGLYGLYSMLDVPVVPVALNAGRVWPKGWTKGPGMVPMAFGAPIPPGLPRAELEVRVHTAINADPRTAEVES